MHLAIETTGRGGSLALWSGRTVQMQVTLPPDQRSAASLAPHVDRALERCREGNQKIDQVTVADGPGSFTGLRIAVTTAKTLAYALSIRLVAVDSLASIAATVFHDHPTRTTALVAIDAYRGQVFWGRFDRQTLLPADVPSSDWSRHASRVTVESMSSFQTMLSGLSEDVALAGDAKPFADRADRLSPRTCDAIGVAMLGAIAVHQGNLLDPMTLRPRYLKPSAAEEARLHPEKGVRHLFR